MILYLLSFLGILFGIAGFIAAASAGAYFSVIGFAVLFFMSYVGLQSTLR